MAFPEQWLCAAIEKATGEKAWPVDVPEGERPPFVVFVRAATEREHYLSYPAGSPVATFEVVVYAPSYIQAKQLASLIRLECDNFTGDHEGVTIQECSLSDERDGEPVDFAGEGKPAYAVEMSFLVRFVE